MAVQNNLLARLNKELPDGWEAKLTPDNGRIYYINHGSQISSWIPPTELWEPGSTAMPYGWECAMDKNSKPYFVNHVDKYTTRDDPRDDPDYIEPPKPRDIELVRDPQKGFGFVAGSEKPVVVRFVTEAGPSVEHLLPGDQIIRINGEDVKKAPREYVIDLVRSCKHTITLTVCQPYSDNSTRKSALLTAAKKAKLKNNPSRVRFAESDTVHNLVNGAALQSPSAEESYVPFMPNVLKVFLENGQTKSFKYDNKTTVKDVMYSLQEKLNIKCVQHFNLVLQNLKSHIPGKMTLLQEHETLAEIAAKPGARHFRCLFRVMFVPRDAYDLLKEDPVAFEYFYVQCCNDVVHERFPEMKSDTVFKLAALQIQQHAMSKNVSGKINIKVIEKECGMEKFVSNSIRDSMKSKDLRKIISQQMKLNQNLTAPGQKQLTALQAKLHYMKIVSELKTFGSRVFMVTLLDKKTEASLLVGPKAGISLITNIKQYTLSKLAEFENIERVKLAKEKENMQRVEVTIKGEQNGMLNLGLLREDAQNFVGIVEGYFRIFVDPNIDIVEKTASKQTGDPDVPPYSCKHKVLVSPWSYPEDIVSQMIETSKNDVSENERVIDFSWGPPAYEEDKEYIAKIKQELGIKPPEEDPDEIISLTRDSENNNEKKESFNKSVIVIEKQPNTIKDYTDGSIKKDIKISDDNVDVSVPKKPRTSIHVNGETDELENRILQNGDMYTPPEFKIGNGDELSDTDSGVESERKLIFGEPFPDTQGPDQESSDTDSWGTPTHSPAKADPDQSFGLHSPDQLPRTEDDFRVIASSFGLLSPDKIPPGIDEGILDSRMFADRQIYLDPDIIDLTLLPPLPPSSNDFSSPGVINYHTWHSAVQQTTSLPENQDIRSTTVHYKEASSPSNGHPPFNRSASVGDNPDFFDLDIDAFIGKMTIPPPPDLQNENSAEETSLPGLLNTWSGPFSIPQVPIDNDIQSSGVTLDDDNFASLVIPPPPGDASESIEEISIVPPVTSSENTENNKKKKSRHRRSSSLDTVLLNKITQSPDSSKNDSENVLNGHRAVPPGTLSTHQTSSTEHSKTPKDFESPATVSERLNILLQSMPNFSSVSNENMQGQGQPFRRTSSLRLTKSASQELTSSLNKSNTGSNSSLQNGSVNKPEVSGSNSSINKPVQSSQEPEYSSKYSRHLRRTHSFDVLPSKDKDNDNSSKTSSDAFSSLKAKLQSYKDFLLNRTINSNKEQKPDSSDDDGTAKPRSSSPFRRSSSFSFGWSRKKNRSSESESKKLEQGQSLEESKENLSRGRSREKKKEKDIPQKVGVSQEKKPQIMNTLATLPISTFRPHTSSGTLQDKATIASSSSDSGDQKSGKKTGPMKALSSVFANSEEHLVTKERERRKREEPVPGSVEQLTKKFNIPVRSKSNNNTSKDKKGSMDDMSLTHTETSSAKKALDTNPFGTITGSMWRPTAMSSRSSIKDADHETYKSFNNFDALRDMAVSGDMSRSGDLSNERSRTESPVAPPRWKGRSRSAGRYPEVSPQLSLKIEKSPENSPQIQPRNSLKDSNKKSSSISKPSNFQQDVGHVPVSPVSKESFTLLKEKIHEHHSDVVKEILKKTYKPKNYSSATADADNLLRELKQTMETLKDSRIDRRPKQFGMCKEELNEQVKQFVYDAKLLVSNATGTEERLASNLEKSMHTLAKIFLHSQATMIMMEAVHQAQHLGFEVIKVTNSYKSTVNAARAAVGKPLSDPHMRYLMRQATNLATLLSNLMKTLKTLQQS